MLEVRGVCNHALSFALVTPSFKEGVPWGMLKGRA